MTAGDLDRTGLEILSDTECLELLGSESVGRIGFVDAGSPAVLPVNYQLDGRSIVFRSGRGSKLSAAALKRPVCFEIDGWDPVGHTGWSVLARGIADEVFDEEAVERLDRLPVRPWSRPDERDRWVRIMVEEMTGRRVVPGS